MVSFKKAISITIVSLILFTALPVNAAQTKESDKATVTEHTPQSRVSDEKELSGGGGSKWLWILLGAAVVAGGAAALASGGADDSSSSSTPSSSEEETGSISGSW